MVLNHRLHYWFHTAGENDERTKLYNRFWQQTYDWGCAHLKGVELSFFCAVLD